MGWVELALASSITAIGATLQGSVGFGLGMFSAPLLILIDTRLIPGPLLCSSFMLTLLLTFRERHSVEFHDLKWALSGRIVGIITAAALLAIVSRDRIALIFGVLILLAVGISISGLHVRPTNRVLLAAGALSGFMGTTVSIGGPPMALVYQHHPGPRIRGTLSAYFTVGVALSLLALHFVGRFGLQEFLLALALLPGIGIGFLISHRTAGILDRGFTRSAVLAVSALAAVGVILKQVI